jgi:hypothetical protein
VKKAPYSSAALENEAADYMERHHHERDAEGRALVVHTAVLEANRIDLLFILIGFEAERAKSPAIQPKSPEESLSATVARICATDKSIQRFCADRTLGGSSSICAKNYSSVLCAMSSPGLRAQRRNDYRSSWAVRADHSNTTSAMTPWSIAAR